MLFDDLLNNPAKWMVESRDEHDIVLTSRIRLARNLTATPFPGWATRQQREETLKLTRTEIRAITRFERGEALISSNNNKVPVVVKASKLEKEMITTDRAELEAILKERQREKTHSA
jgi:protein-arginine kinase